MQRRPQARSRVEGAPRDTTDSTNDCRHDVRPSHGIILRCASHTLRRDHISNSALLSDNALESPCPAPYDPVCAGKAPTCTISDIASW